jgi:hypothetical protein
MKPMLDDAAEPGFVRELLQAGANDRVADYNYDQGLASHLSHVAAGTPPPPWAEGLTAGSSTAVGGGIAAKTALLWAGLPIATAGFVAAVVLGGDVPRHDASAGASDTAVVQEQPALEETGIEDDLPVVQPAPAVVTEPEAPGDSITRTEPSPEPARRARTDGRRISANDETTGELPGETVAVGDDVLSHQSPRPEIGSPEPEPAPAESGGPTVRAEDQAGSDPLQRDMQMLAAANRLLHSNPERALAMARAGDREFPNSMFVEERGHILILALIKLGRTDEARKHAWPYLRRYPKGPFAERVRRALASGKVR